MGRGLFFLIGSAVGAVAALMVSPGTGKENREYVTEKVSEVAEQPVETIREAADTVKEKIQGAQAAAPEPAADDIRIKINEARDRIAEQVARNSGVTTTVEAEVTDAAEEAAEQADE